MNTLDLWKNVEKLSVDEFMHLLLGLEPGTENFSFYGRQFTWPKKAVPIYNMLAEDIKSGKLSVAIEGYWNDPRVNKQLVSHYAHTGEPWWEDGKLDKHELVKWLAEKGIQSEFFNVPQSISTNVPTIAVHESPSQDVPATPINLPPASADGHTGIKNATIQNSAAYLQSWIRTLRGDRKLAIIAAAQAQKAADYILNRKDSQDGE